jgi:ATP-dependent protease ClpP protease subunit
MPKTLKPKGRKQPWLTVMDMGDATEFVISGTIGSSWYDDSGTTSKEFRDKLSQVPAGRKVNVRINSEGGSVGDALEIYNVLQARAKDVTCFVDGYALSSASIIALGGGRTIAPHSSILMIHEPWSMTVGNEADHTKAATMLAKHGDTLAGIYARKTGKTTAEMRAAMKDETWFTGAEAVAAGLADAATEDSTCPDCDHPQCSDCTVDGDDITCCQCGATNTEEDWEDDGDEIENRFASLNLAQFRSVPQVILNMVKSRTSTISKTLSAPVAGVGAAKQPAAPVMGAAPAKENKMNKTAILALLKKRGVELGDDATEEQILAALEQSEPDNTKPNAEVLDLRKQLDAEKKIRITAEVTRRAENRIENKNLPWWIALALSDESGTYAQIESLPLARPGGEPIAGSISTVENRLEAIKKEPVAAKRFATLKAEWNGLIADAQARDQRQRLTPMNSNTYSASLVTQFLLDGAVTALQNRWAPLNVFTKDYSSDRYKPRATGQLKFVTGGSTTQKNATNFEQGDSVVTNVQIAVDQYSQPFHVTNDELNSGLRMENLIDVNIAYLADSILEVAFAPLNTTDYGAGQIIRAPAAFNFSDMASAWGALKKSPIKYAVLDGEYIARIINTPAFFQATDSTGDQTGWKRFGWDGVYLNTNWSGTHAGAGDQSIRGLFCNPQALGAIAGLPLTPPSIPGSTLQESTITVPDVDISITAYSWFSLASRTFWMSYDLMFGSAKLDPTAGVLLTSA